MTEYRDLLCDDDLDPFGRETDPLETYLQDCVHRLYARRGSMLRSLEFGIGIEDYLSAPIAPNTLAQAIETNLALDDRTQAVRCTIERRGEVFLATIQLQANDQFLSLVLQLDPKNKKATLLK